MSPAASVRVWAESGQPWLRSQQRAALVVFPAWLRLPSPLHRDADVAEDQPFPLLPSIRPLPTPALLRVNPGELGFTLLTEAPRVGKVV